MPSTIEVTKARKKRMGLMPALFPETEESLALKRKRNKKDGKKSSALKIQDNRTIYCICRSTDISRFMIACDKCNEWYHGDCINVKEEDSYKIANYYCEKCQKEYKTLQTTYVKDPLLPSTSHSSIAPSQQTFPNASSVTANSAQVSNPSLPQSSIKRKSRKSVPTNRHTKSSKPLKIKIKERHSSKSNKSNNRMDMQDKKNSRQRGSLTKYIAETFDNDGTSIFSTSESDFEDSNKRKRLRTQSDSREYKRRYLSESSIMLEPQIHRMLNATNTFTPMYSPVVSSTLSNLHNPLQRPTCLSSLRLDDSSEDELLEEHQCRGPGCGQCARFDSKYCCDKCGFKLASDRIFHFLPECVHHWSSTHNEYVEYNKIQLQTIRQEQSVTVARLHLLDSECKSLKIYYKNLKSISMEPILIHESIDEQTILCVICGLRISKQTAPRHVEKCSIKQEELSAINEERMSNFGGRKVICDQYDVIKKTYCKRLRILCSEHCKDEPIYDNEICGAPLCPTASSNLRICCISKRLCYKHSSWYKLHRADIDLDRIREFKKLDKLKIDETILRNNLACNGGLLPLILHCTLNQNLKNQQTKQQKQFNSPQVESINFNYPNAANFSKDMDNANKTESNSGGDINHRNYIYPNMACNIKTSEYFLTAIPIKCATNASISKPMNDAIAEYTQTSVNTKNTHFFNKLRLPMAKAANGNKSNMRPLIGPWSNKKNTTSSEIICFRSVTESGENASSLLHNQNLNLKANAANISTRTANELQLCKTSEINPYGGFVYPIMKGISPSNTNMKMIQHKTGYHSLKNSENKYIPGRTKTIAQMNAFSNSKVLALEPVNIPLPPGYRLFRAMTPNNAVKQIHNFVSEASTPNNLKPISPIQLNEHNKNVRIMNMSLPKSNKRTNEEMQDAHRTYAAPNILISTSNDKTEKSNLISTHDNDIEMHNLSQATVQAFNKNISNSNTASSLSLSKPNAVVSSETITTLLSTNIATNVHYMEKNKYDRVSLDEIEDELDKIDESSGIIGTQKCNESEIVFGHSLHSKINEKTSEFEFNAHSPETQLMAQTNISLATENNYLQNVDSMETNSSESSS